MQEIAARQAAAQKTASGDRFEPQGAVLRELYQAFSIPI